MLISTPEKVYMIAEIGQAHEGSLGIAHSYIDALANTGVDAVKFQTHIAEAESSEFEPFRIKFSYEDETRFDYWKRMEFTFEQWVGIKKHCEDIGMEYLSTPFSNAAVDLLERLGVKKYKVGSGDVNNLLMLNKLASTGKPVILSSGMSSFEELDKAVELLNKKGNEVSILQCTTAYPTKPKTWGLNVISELKSRYKIPIGFSDHSGGIYAGIAAATLGAEILEFHVVFDKAIFGPDAKASLTIDQVKQLVIGVQQIKTSLGNRVDKNDNTKYNKLKKIFERSLACNTDIKSGQKITINDLEAKKPKGMGIDAMQFEKVIGRKLFRNIDKWEFLKFSDLKNE